ncbi:MAG: hypothetical protein KJ077_25760 [Anaerolineae bacterium]|nr:hypothetical protein [Anaerolineae bacterium]
MAAIQTNTGLPQSIGRRWHFDIYAVLEGAQELYFGHETQVNLNLVEIVSIDKGDPDDEGQVIEKCYLSPTKRRGVERRTLIWSPLADGRLLGDKLGCGIPHTCAQPHCPICAVYGGMITSEVEVGDAVPNDGNGKRKAITYIGRLVHGGGVAVQAIEPSEKQRALYPSMIHKELGAAPTPTPFKKQYNEPALLYPVYNHVMSVSEAEFAAVAYAFLESLARLGAGNPKGLRLYETDLLGKQQPLLVFDQYLTPWGKRPIVSPALTSKNEAIEQFCSAALSVHGQTIDQDSYTQADGLFKRWLGEAALMELQNYALAFTIKNLT